MMPPMRSKLLALMLPAVLALSAVPAHAQATDDEQTHDARLEGFENTNGTMGPLAINPPSGTAGTYFLSAILGVVCFGVMCKNGKRTHLD